MAVNLELTTFRKGLDQICDIPEKIISVYSLEKHVWADSHSAEAFKDRSPELKTVEEFQIDPVRHFLNDIFRNMAAPYRPENRENPIGQGYWIQAEFGSGKSHLLCFLASLSLGSKKSWEIIKVKETKAERGKRESLYRFWEEGLESKSTKSKGIFVIVKTLVGSGGGTVGYDDTGKRLTQYILDAAKDQMQKELGKNVSLYPVELLADRFLKEDIDRYRNDLKKFLKDPRFREEDEIEDVDDFIRDIQENKSPRYKLSCGNKLWRFYTDYLKVQPQIEAEAEDILKHMVETILAEGYSGVLLLLDEVSLFMKDRTESQRTDDEKTLVVLSNRLAKVHNLPIWTVCAAQQAIESKMGVKNLIAKDRLEEVRLLGKDKDYYDIILSRVRKIKNPEEIIHYYTYYKRGFTWPNAIGEDEFKRFFPFHKPALEVLKAITYELTTTRSAIHFMHQTLRYQMEKQSTDLIRLWDFFDEALSYEEDPSGTNAGLVAIKNKRDAEYRVYEDCRRQIDSVTKGPLKVYRDPSIKTLQTLFLYHISRNRQQGLTPEDIANSVLIERSSDATIDENIMHYQSIADNLRKALRQVVASSDEDNKPLYRFDPVSTGGIDPKLEFEKALSEAQSSPKMQHEAWQHLLALDEWPVRTRQITYDLTSLSSQSSSVRSIFRDIAPFIGPWEIRDAAKAGRQILQLSWQNRQISGIIEMLDLERLSLRNESLPPLESADSDLDFAVYVGTKPADQNVIDKLLLKQSDPRIILWTPGERSTDEQDRLLEFAAYRKLVSDHQGKDSEDDVAVINWVADQLKTDLGRIARIVNNCYARGRIDALNHSNMDFHVAGELSGILTSIIDRVLSAAYVSRDIKFDPYVFSKEDGIKVINGIVKTGQIPKGAKPDKNVSAAQNFGIGLGIVKKTDPRKLDASENTFVQDILSFIDNKADGGQAIKIDTFYKNFMGINGPNGKNYGLSRRMVQIYLLSLVQQGKIRLSIGSKSGLQSNYIDYSNIANIDFNTKVLDSILDVQKTVLPENWDVLRPYAEKILGKPIADTKDDSVISLHRKDLRSLFELEKERSSKVLGDANDLFSSMNRENPYEIELQQISKFFSIDLDTGNDIDAILYALKSFGYKAFEDGFSQSEADDLANRLKNYKNMQALLKFKNELEIASDYCSYTIPDLPELKTTRAIQKSLAQKISNIQPYIDSELKLNTELIGKTPPQPGDSGSISALIHEYTLQYAAMHDRVTSLLEESRGAIQKMLGSDELKAIAILDGINAIHEKEQSSEVTEKLEGHIEEIFSCANPSRAAIDKALKTRTEHDCGLSFNNYSREIESAQKQVQQSREIFEAFVNKRMEFFLTPAIRDLLRQGESEPVIFGLLKCSDLPEIRTYLVDSALKEPSLVKTINHYLKRIIIKPVRISDFKPKQTTLERDQIQSLVAEFRCYLEDQFKGENASDSRLMLRLE
jgi:hypothetical protein